MPVSFVADRPQLPVGATIGIALVMAMTLAVGATLLHGDGRKILQSDPAKEQNDRHH